MAFKKVAVSLVLSAMACAVHAIVNGIDPETASTANPESGVQSDLWKLTGTVSGVSAVQIAPRWILASRHGTPPQGAVFSNKHGQATILQDCAPAPGTYVVTGINDFSLCRLSTAIAIPASASFAPLAGVGDADLDYPEQFDHWGDLLSVGTSGGSRRIAWTHFSGVPNGLDPYDFSLNPTGIAANVAPRIPYGYSGDSGGGVFLFPYDYSTTGVLVGVITGGTYMGSAPTYLTRANVNWITSTISGYGETPPTAIPIEQLVGDATVKLPRMMPDNSVTAAVTGATTATLTWAAPPANPNNTAPITRYLVRFQGEGDVGPRVLTKSQAGTVTLTALTDGSRYQACVLTGGATGYGSNARIVLQSSTVQQLYRPGCASFIAGQPNTVTIGDWDVSKNTATGKTDVYGNWSVPVANGVSIGGYVVTVKVWPSASSYIGKNPAIRTTVIQTPATSFQLPNVSSGTEHACWSVTARSASQVLSASTPDQCFGTVP